MALKEEMQSQGNWLFKYRGTLPLVILVFGLILYIQRESNPDFILGHGTIYELVYDYICLAIGLLGLYIRVYAVGHTPANTSGRNTAQQEADEVNSSGIYSIVRHPLYLGNFFMWLGVAMLVANFWFIIAFCLAYWVYYERIMYAEEAYMTGKFGEKYTQWASVTPAFIPNFKTFKKPILKFSWKKILRREKNSLAALTLLFAMFDILGQIINGEYKFNYVFTGLCIASMLLYLVLNYLKYKTNVLSEEGR